MPGVPEALVINLAANTDRLARFIQSYKASEFRDIPLRRIEAVDGRRVDWSRYLTAEALEQLMTVQKSGFRAGHPDLTPGAVGCYLSHMEAWRHIADSGLQYGVVFEDDASVPPGALPALYKALRGVPRGWDVVLLGYEGKGAPVSPGLLRMTKFLRLHAYAITGRTARSLLSTMLPIKQQVDWELSDRTEQGLAVYGMDPSAIPVAWQGTDIQIPLAPNA